MKRRDKYGADAERLAFLMEKYTGIPRYRMMEFLSESTPSDMLTSANSLCKTDAQRERLTELFEFKNLYESMKAENSRDRFLFSTGRAKEYFKARYADMNDKERFSVAFLGGQSRVIKTKEMSAGTTGALTVYPREILKEALFVGAKSLIMAHNHTGGPAVPSPEDIDITERIKTLLDIVDIRLRDHIIVAGDDAVSLAEHGYIGTDIVTPERRADPPTGKSAEANHQRGSVREKLAAGKKHPQKRAAAPKNLISNSVKPKEPSR